MGEFLRPGEEELGQEKSKEKEALLELIEGSDLVEEGQKEQMAALLKESPESVKSIEKEHKLQVPEELLEKFKEDREKIIQEFMAGTEASVQEWFEANLPDVQNKEKAIVACTELENHIIKAQSQDFIEGKIDDLDFSDITILVKVAEYKDSENNEVSVVIGFDVLGQKRDEEGMVPEKEKEGIREAKEEGTYKEENR